MKIRVGIRRKITTSLMVFISREKVGSLNKYVSKIKLIISKAREIRVKTNLKKKEIFKLRAFIFTLNSY